MRKAKPPVGWERAKSCFPVPNELLCFDLPAGAVAVYAGGSVQRVGKALPARAQRAAGGVCFGAAG